MQDINQIQFLLLGGGFTLSNLAEHLPKESFLITTTSAEKVQGFTRLGYHAMQLDIEDTDAVSRLFASLPAAHTIVDSIPPLQGENEMRGVENIIEALDGTGIKRVFYLSTTGVFGVTDGSWVDENTPVQPENRKAQNRVACEDLYRTTGLETTAFRIAGIYGLGRGLGAALKKGSYQLVDKGNRWSNRIHVEDLARALQRALQWDLNITLPQVLCVSDDEPAPIRDVVEFYCQTFALPLPASITFEEAAQNDMHSLTSSQRVSNALLKSTLNMTLRYPTYREGARTEFE